MKRTIQLSFTLISLLGSLHAQEEIKLEPISITSTAIKTDELKSTDAVEVYTSEDIEQAHVQNVYEFLNSQTSVVSMPSYGNPFSQKLDIHGYGIGDGYQNIAVTLNGRKVNNIDMVAPLLSSISPASIEKIEIIKSSGIVTGGDGSSAGSINITTKKNNDKEITVYGGTYGLFDGAFYLGSSDDKLSVNASGEAQKNSGIRHIDAQGNKDENKLSTGTFNLAYAPIEELELRAGASYARTDVIYASYLIEDEYKADATQAGATNWGAAHQLYDTDALNAGVSYYISDALSLNIDGSHEKKKSNSLTYGYIADYDYNSAKTSLDYLSESLNVSAGVDIFDGARNSHASAWSIANETKKDNLAGFIMSNFNVGDSSLKAGYRYEKVSYKFSDATKSNSNDNVLHGAELGYNYTLDKEKSIFINYAHSYQAPDIDRFFSGGVFNTFISPMQANNYTVGFNDIKSNNKFKISAYFIDLKNEIYYHSITPYTGDNTNIDKSHKYGLDLYDKYIISGMWNIALNYNYVQAIIDDEKVGSDDYSGNKLPGVSDHNAKATLSYLPTPHATIALSEMYRSEAYAANDFNNNFSQKQDAYISTDISATYAKDNYEVFAKINNLFNQKNGLWIQDDAIYPVNFTTTAIVGFKLKY